VRLLLLVFFGGVSESFSLIDFIPLFIRTQNAGLIFRRRAENVVVETFEASAENEAVLACTGRLICTYPGPSVAFPFEILQRDTFRGELASFLAQMNVDVLDGAVSLVEKAGSSVPEVRNTAHPRYICDLLVGILGAFKREENVTYEVSKITKHISDDVLWDDCLLPWRRSPVWLVLRVALQTSLNPSDDHRLYKALIAFIMSGILNRAIMAEYPSDILSFMRRKLARRAAKMASRMPDFVAEEVSTVLNKAQRRLQSRWDAVQIREQQDTAITPWSPTALKSEENAKLSLPNSRRYLEHALSRKPAVAQKQGTSTIDLPNLYRSIVHDSNFSSIMKTAQQFSDSTNEVTLSDFEHAIRRMSSLWRTDLSIVAASTSPHSLLSAAMKGYAKAAQAHYKLDPEGQSLMLLTLADLWVILDGAVLQQIPLLEDYPPDVPLTTLEPLLLRNIADIQRLKDITAHIVRRHIHAQGPSIFEPPNNKSFAVQFFNDSHVLQQEKIFIEELATQRREKKVAEMARLNERHRILTDEASLLQHHPTCGNLTESGECVKCKKEAFIRAMSIATHEWPLPADDSLCKAVIFETRRPEAFTCWREATYFFVHDICTSGNQWTAKEPPMRGDIIDYMRGHTTSKNLSPVSRVTFGTTQKAFKSSHYRRVAIPQTMVERVCRNNGCKWKLYDCQNALWIGKVMASAGTEILCTTKLPGSPLYKGLSSFMGTRHSVNEVLLQAKEKCSADLNPLEYVAFGSLRSGGRTQWLNIARELLAGHLTFSSVHVRLLCVQAALQVGPILPDGVLDWHQELLSSAFCNNILAQMESIHMSVTDNWMEMNTIQTMIMFTSRILVFNRDDDVLDRAINNMRALRKTVFHWLALAIDSLNSTSDHSSASRNIEGRICELAVICRMTFDVDPTHRQSLLSREGDLTILLRCQIAISDYGSSTDTDDTVTSSLFRKDRQLSRELLDDVVKIILRNPGELNAAIGMVWDSYRPCGNWVQLKHSQSQWVHTCTEFTETQLSQAVHLDLLTGQFLVNGKSVSRLPPEIVKHSLFKDIFGNVCVVQCHIFISILLKCSPCAAKLLSHPFGCSGDRLYD
jgi:hypothetical protein